MLKQYAKHVTGLNPRHGQVQNREERPTSAHNVQLLYCVHYVRSMEGLFKGLFQWPQWRWKVCAASSST